MKRLTSSILLTLFGLLFVISLTAAQAIPRDYVVSRPRFTLVDNGATVRIQVIVGNQGGDASEESTIELYDAATNALVESQTLPALASGESRTFTFNIDTANYDAGSQQVFRVEAGIDDYELAGAPISANNATRVSVPIPGEGTITTPAPGASPAPATQPDSTVDADAPFIVFHPDNSITVAGRTFTQNDLFISVLILCGTALMLWIFSLVLRLLFGQPPAMGNWQPPYATVPMMDPNSLSGRRQAWQLHAQNGLILAPPQEGAFHPVKLLLGMDGIKLSHWQFKAMRLAQYDSYGRVARTYSLAPKKAVNRLNKIMRQRQKLDEEKLRKRLRPVARDFTRVLKKRIRKNSAFLPVALDLRLEGKHGEVRILFELWSYQNANWHRVDQWEPELYIHGKRLQENYSYTIHGQSGGETLKEFHRRLEDDVLWLLLETIILPVPEAYNNPQPQPRETFDTPDTLTNMKPITDSNAPV